MPISRTIFLAAPASRVPRPPRVVARWKALLSSSIPCVDIVGPAGLVLCWIHVRFLSPLLTDASSTRPASSYSRRPRNTSACPLSTPSAAQTRCCTGYTGDFSHYSGGIRSPPASRRRRVDSITTSTDTQRRHRPPRRSPVMSVPAMISLTAPPELTAHPPRVVLG